MSDLDHHHPLETLRRAMRLQEQVAAAESKKGAKARLGVMSTAMSAAASIAKTIAEVEDRRGLTQAPPSKPWDLTKLTDRQLHTLDKLAAICLGEAPPDPLPRVRRSKRFRAAEDLVVLLDLIEAEGPGAGEIRWSQVHGLMGSLIYPMATMCDVHGPRCARTGTAMPCHEPRKAAEADSRRNP
jgi:hypothetical protein